MPAWYTAILLESGTIQWRPKTNADIPDSGPEDHKLIIEYEGELEALPWISDLSCGKASIDANMLAAQVPHLFDKPWLRGHEPLSANISMLGNHNIIEIHLS